ncbi:MAG: 23S rRNA (uracil(1939)-C(5))-methyltransferase RlmD, partial [Eggerthellaceae bacterium]|nr:23S rRNA (uracil(1939)-C(5))-methyltransferase RlmD [Eggerthellaceae bacterium]
MHKTFHIERLCYGADAIAHDENGRTVFVAGGVPGDVVEVELVEEKARFARGVMVGEPIETSEFRIAPKCAACGGCPWAHISYEYQIQAKTANVRDALIRTGHLDAERVDAILHPCIPSPDVWGYRNKIELNVQMGADGRLALGMAEAASRKLSPIDACPLAVKAAADAPKALRGALRYLAGTSDLGLFRVGVRASKRTKELEVSLWTNPGSFPRAQAVKILRQALPKATSIVRVIADEGKARTVKTVEALWGRGCWSEDLAGARFQTSAPSFFQVNTPQAEVLVKTALEFLGGEDALNGAYVADLYSGGGTFSIPLAKASADVVAVESAGSSVRDLRRNAHENGVEEAIEVIGGDTARELPELGELDALIVDPPRAGLADGVPESIAAAHPAKVVYVSCDPATLARDIARLEKLDYQMAAIQPVDLFPQTF